jgi:uroporphyrinogen-III synthase
MQKIKNLLVSLPAPAVIEKSPFFELSKKYGLAVDYTPFIRVEGESVKEFRTQRVEILTHTAVIFTSRTTIDHFFRICEESRIAVPESMKYLCYTEAIALYLQKYIIYRKRKISFADGTFSGLMELVLKHRDEKLLLALSEPHKPEIPQTLEKLKVKFDRAIFSHTVSSDLSEVDLSRHQMVVLYSPPEVKALVEKFAGVGVGVGTGAEATGEMPLVATFGEGTTRKAVESGLKVSVMAPTPEAPSMSRALDLFIGNFNAGREIAPIEVPHDRKPQMVEEFVKTHQIKDTRKAKPKKKPAAASGSASASASGSAAASSGSIRSASSGASSAASAAATRSVGSGSSLSSAAASSGSVAADSAAAAKKQS